MAVLWGASVQGVSNKLPTRMGKLVEPQVVDNLETASGMLLALVGSEDAVPLALWEFAARVVETGAAALTEQQDFPEESTAKTSLAAVLWAQFMGWQASVQAGVEALGGEPPTQERPAYSFAPPAGIQRARW